MSRPCIEEAELRYTIDDDGIWLMCGRCGFEYNLGHFPTVAKAQEVLDEYEHR